MEVSKTKNNAGIYVVLMDLFYWDLISSLVIVFIAYPVVRLIESRQPIYLLLAAGVFAWIVLLELRRFLPKFITHLMVRPSQARNCNVINQGGYHGQAIGMPSGHVLITAYVTFTIYLLHPSWITLCFSVVSTLLVAMARMAKNCHTFMQTIVGSTLGILSGYLTIWVSKRFFYNTKNN